MRPTAETVICGTGPSGLLTCLYFRRRSGVGVLEQVPVLRAMGERAGNSRILGVIMGRNARGGNHRQRFSVGWDYPAGSRGLYVRWSWRAGLKGREAHSDGVFGEFGDGAEVELVHDALAVPDDGFGGDEEGVGDFLGTFALGDPFEDLALPLGELLDFVAGEDAFFRISAEEVVGDEVGDVVGEKGGAGHDGADGGGELGDGAGLEDISGGAGAKHVADDVSSGVHGESDDFGFGEGFADAAHGFDAVEAGHGDVEDHDIGVELLGEFEGALAALGFSDDFDFPVGSEQALEAFEDHLMVIDQ